MSPKRISRPLIREAPLLRHDTRVEEAVQAILDRGLPAETFLHHRVLIVPVRGDDGLEGVITRGAAELIDAYGLLAVFAAGLGFRRYEFEHQYNERVHQGAQVVQNFAELAVILLLGSLVTSDLLSDPGYPAGSWYRCCSASSGRLPYSSPPRLQARRWTAASGRWSPGSAPRAWRPCTSWRC